MPQVNPRLAAAMANTLGRPAQPMPQQVVPVPVAVAPQQMMPQRSTTGVNAGELGVPWNFRFGQRR